MRLFSRTIVKREEATRVALDYQPKKFPFQMTEVATSFVQNNPNHGAPGTFRMNDLISERTGLADIERQSAAEVIEAKALEKLKEIQESAYREAHTLGLDEGREEARKKYEEELSHQMKELANLIESLARMKQDLVNSNEAHIVKLIYYVASRIAMHEIEQKPDAILPVLKNAVDESMVQEQMTIRLSPQDFKFINENRESLSNEFEYLKNARLQESAEIRTGGCIIETNYGVIDATLEERVGHLMDTLLGATPKVRDSIAS